MSLQVPWPSWMPDWLQASLAQRSSRVEESASAGGILNPRGDGTVNLSEQPIVQAALPQGKTDDDGFTRRNRIVIVTPSRDRVVDRKLRGLQLSMIAVNATLGTGLYWRGGQILELGGPLAVSLSFLLPGLLAWAVMQCITEMLCIWPVPGALSVYVSEFVDVELGIATGVAYWYTYSVSFAALIATAAAEFHYWLYDNKAFDGGVVYLLIPLVLILVNSFPVEIYGWLEVLGSSLKVLCLMAVMCALVAINIRPATSTTGPRGPPLWLAPTAYDKDAAQNWFTCLAMSFSIATFAYVGVEVVAASALEARWPGTSKKTASEAADVSRQPDEELLVGKTVKFSAVYIPILATLLYVLAGLLASFSTQRQNCKLPRLSWISSTECVSAATNTSLQHGNTESIFVIIATDSGIPLLSDVFNVFLVFSALTCANTNLYVASRTLFGLTTRLDGSHGQPSFLRFLAWFGKTNRRKVPMRAMIVSALAFCWVPFLQLQGGNNIDMVIEILATMGSDGVVIVWACECWAFIRYYHCIYKHRAVLEAQRVSQVRRWDQENYHDYPYRSHGQPILAYAALTGCLFILLVANGATQWNGFHIVPFLSTFLLPLVFIALWISLKVVRGAKWSLVDLSHANKVVNKIRDLHDIRLGAS